MLYHLFENLQQNYDIIGSGVFQYLSFRAGMAALLSLIISIIFGKKNYFTT
jgi:phospho-N-acetylmuramoyl-pentapeptide-transferase